MEFESAQSAAERLGVTVRAVQKWAKDGKLPGARKMGRDWQIPIGIAVPKDMTENNTLSKPISLRMPMPLLNSAFPVGTCRTYIESIQDCDERNIALGEYYYYSGQAEMATKLLEPYMDSEEPAWRYTARVMCGYANLSREHFHVSRMAFGAVKKELEENLGTEETDYFRALGAYEAACLTELVKVSVKGAPPVEEHLRHMPNGMQLFACFLLARKAYYENNYERALAIADMALAFGKEDYQIATIYVELIASVALMNLMRIDEAKVRFQKVWEQAHADGLIKPFAEYHALLQGLIEVMLRKQYPEEYDRIIEITNHFRAGWQKMRNEEAGRDGIEHLTATEFTLAMLYYRGWTTKEIASHMEISARTVNNKIQIVYAKLGITSKKELGQFMLH